MTHVTHTHARAHTHTSTPIILLNLFVWLLCFCLLNFKFFPQSWLILLVIISQSSLPVICGWEFYVDTNYYHDLFQNADTKHWKSRPLNSTVKDRFICKYCGKSYGSNVGLWYHIREHEGKFSYTCNYCGKGFNRKGQYDEHISAHEGRGYLCLKCHKVFKTDSLLKKHRATCSQ